MPSKPTKQPPKPRPVKDEPDYYRDIEKTTPHGKVKPKKKRKAMSHARHTLIKSINEAIASLVLGDASNECEVTAFPYEFFDCSLAVDAEITSGILPYIAAYIYESIQDGDMDSEVGSRQFLLDYFLYPESDPRDLYTGETPEYFIFGMDDFMFAVQEAVERELEGMDEVIFSSEGGEYPYSNMTAKKARFGFNVVTHELELVRVKKVKTSVLKRLLGKLSNVVEVRKGREVRSMVMRVVDKALDTVTPQRVINVLTALAAAPGAWVGVATIEDPDEDTTATNK